MAWRFETDTGSKQARRRQSCCILSLLFACFGSEMPPVLLLFASHRAISVRHW
jgi:hypothetical protein